MLSIKSTAMRIAGVAVIASGLMFAATQPQAAELGDTDTAIKIPINEWTGQHLSAHLLGQLLNKLGYKTEYVTAGAVPQFTAMVQGDLHVQPETWENNVGDIYPKAVEAGDLLIVGESGVSAREGWIYPPYMKEKCPGLPDWKALYDCAQAFGTPETFPKGRLVTYPADWGTRSKDLVEQIKLPFVPVAGGSEGAMVAEIKAAYDAQQPMLMMFWQPHWLFADYEFEWVDWPKDPKECEEKAGLASGTMTECGFQQAKVLKVTWKDFKTKWPAAQVLVENFAFTNEQQNPLIAEVDNKGRKIEEVVAEWISNNEAVWKPWIDAAKN
jgi:glycine betaine/proline transport system substrate-binding protein